ncbi:hypothetical protein [Corynebacterium sp.]|uniref:hypothetical protein n=1 Tax=Corynebacterium sp. TaxID=1720 RepID=UPI002A914C37|nr:hypothetical protein [Corynebacterium sp.]MDY5786283.1 hypothetical protein [Corynebacterium sp.]
MSTRSRNDFAQSLTAIVIGTVIWCIPEIIQMARTGSFITRLSPALPQGLLAGELSGGAVTFLTTALVLKYAALTATAVFLARALVPMMRGEIFTAGNIRNLNVAGWMMGVWILVRLGVEGMANNLAASELGVEHWWETASRTPLSDIAPAFALTITLGILASVVKRGAALEKEVEGLV